MVSSKRAAYLLLSLLLFGAKVQADPGTEGASFLDIPVGAGPAAVGSAYSALASDAYAPVWNPGGLGLIHQNQFAAQHLSYVETIHYEFASFVHPMGKDRAWGASIQYLGTGDVSGTDETGKAAPDFSSYYAAYSVAYGQALGQKLSLGVTGKMITAKISDVSASAYAFDFGSMYQATPRFRLAGVLRNLGTKLTFLDQGDSLPLAFHLGAAYEMTPRLTVTAEGVYPKTGTASFHTGMEWSPMENLALRMGYKTDTVKSLESMAGFTTGVGIKVSGYELSYAWVPLGDLGSTHYLSFIGRFGGKAKSNRNLALLYKPVEKPKPTLKPDDVEVETLEELLSTWR